MKSTSIKTIITLIALTALPLNAFAKTFSDIDETNPYFLAATYLSEKNVISGYADGSFKPFENINRAELLKILMEGAEVEIIAPQTNCFSDVPYTQWYAPYVCTAKELKFIKGYEDGTFKPSQNINKVEALKMLGEIYKWDLEAAKDTEVFTDTPKDSWYIPYLKFAKMKNILPESGGKYNPSNSITRGSISETLYRFLASEEFGEEVYSKTVKDLVKQSLEISDTTELSAATLNTEKPTSTINGIITDAQTAKSLKDSTIALYDSFGNFIQNTSSDINGEFAIEDSLDSTYYLSISKDGYFTLEIPIFEIAENEIHISLSKTFTQVDPEELRIVLTWEDKDVDFDAHLLTPEAEEIYFMHRLDAMLNTILDVDSTKANGTETITIKNFEEGTYEYFVHNYSNTDNFYSAGARVEVYDKNGLAKIYYSKNTEGEIWKVFELSSNGNITDVDVIGTCESLEITSSICPAT